MVHPVLAGDGLRSLTGSRDIDLRLSDIQTFDSGSAVHVYDQPHPRDVA